MENLTERRIKILRSDNGGEYTSKEIIAFCKESGIKRELIVPYNPEQNGIVERKNRSIQESVKAMLHDQDLSKFLWGEATKTIVYIQNRSPHKSLDNKTSKEVFTGKKPSADLWVSYIYPYTKGQKKEAGSFRHEGNISWV